MVRTRPRGGRVALLSFLLVLAALIGPGSGAGAVAIGPAAAPGDSSTLPASAGPEQRAGVRTTKGTNTITDANASVNLSVARARGALFGDLTDAESVRAARTRGEIVRSTLPVTGALEGSAFVPGDLLVVRLESERLAARLEARPGDTPTERFRSLLNETGAALAMVQTADTVSPQRQRKVLATNATRLRVVGDGDVRWVLIDTGNAAVAYGDRVDATTQFRPGEAYGVGFGLTANATIAEQSLTRVSVASAELRLDVPSGRERFFVRPGVASVAVESTLAPGTPVTVALEGATGIRHRTVRLNGSNLTRAAPQFDLSSVPANTYLDTRLYVGSPSETERRVEGAAVDRAGMVVDHPTARLLIADRTPTAVTVRAELSWGGTLLLETADGQRLDVATVDPGTTEEVLSLPPADFDGPIDVRVVALRLTEGTEAGRVPYIGGDDDPVTLTLTMDPTAPTQSPGTGPPTEPPTSTPTVPPPGTTVPAGTSSGDGPGFGVFGAGVAVLLLVSLGRLR